MGLFAIPEFGKIKSDNDFDQSSSAKQNDVIIPSKSFDQLWAFLMERQSVSSEAQKAFDLYTRHGKRIIRAKNHVGVIETKAGDVIEVLPKVFRTDSLATSKHLLVRMLSVLQGYRNISFQSAGIDSVDNFPILDVFIQNFIHQLETLLFNGVKSDYQVVRENQRFLKGRLLFGKQISQNAFNKTKFYVQYSKYIEDIPLNRIIKSSLDKLVHVTKDLGLVARINRLSNFLTDIPQSKDINGDLFVAKSGNRLFSQYKEVIDTAEAFLLNKGITNYSGELIHQALLFPMEKVFESFVAHQFKRHSESVDVFTQHDKLHLIDNFRNAPRFKLKPDIFVKDSDELNPHIVIDTKWKLVSDNLKQIDQSDLYQLYAYGKKYTREYGKTVLCIIYPKNSDLSLIEENVVFDHGEENELVLSFQSFDLLGNYSDQVMNIVGQIRTQMNSVTDRQFP